MFQNDEINVSEKRIKANIPLHFELGGITVYPGRLIYTVFVGKWLRLYLGRLKLGRGL